MIRLLALRRETWRAPGKLQRERRRLAGESGVFGGRSAREILCILSVEPQMPEVPIPGCPRSGQCGTTFTPRRKAGTGMVELFGCVRHMWVPDFAFANPGICVFPGVLRIG